MIITIKPLKEFETKEQKAKHIDNVKDKIEECLNAIYPKEKFQLGTIVEESD